LVFLLSSEQPEHLLTWLGGKDEKWLLQLGLAAEDGYIDIVHIDKRT